MAKIKKLKHYRHDLTLDEILDWYWNEPNPVVSIYTTPKLALFNFFDFSKPYAFDPIGYAKKEEKVLVLGIEDENYITTSEEVVHVFKINGHYIKRKYTHYSGPHQSYFEKFLPTQIDLF
jgi:hypothetical protein